MILVACGGGEVDVTSLQASAAGGAQGVSGSSGTGGGASGTGGAPGSAGAPICPNSPIPSGGSGGKVGTVEIVTYRASDTINSSVTALFASGGDANGTAACQVTKLSPCVVRTCPSVPPDPTSRFESAGTLTVTGGAFPVSIDPQHTTTDPTKIAQGTDYGYASSVGKQLYVGGEALVVSTPGASVPALATTVAAPSAITLLTPAAGATIDPAGPLSLTWTPNATATFLALDLSTNACGITTHVVCTFPAQDGAASVPAGALASLHGSVTASVSGLGTQLVNAGDYIMTVDVHDRTGSPPRMLALP